MKILKIKFGLFSLLAILTAAVFLTSCEQEHIDITDETSITESNDVIEFILPETMNDQPESEIIHFVENLSEEEIIELSEMHPVNEIDARSCGNWSTIWSGTTLLYFYYNPYPNKYCRYRRKSVQRRWCGSPSGGGYDYRTVYSYYTTRCW